MFNVELKGNKYAVRFCYEKPIVHRGKDGLFINTHCEIVLKGNARADDKVICSGNTDVRLNKFNRAVTRKSALAKALSRGSVTIIDGKEHTDTFFTRAERAEIWRKYFATINGEDTMLPREAKPA